MQFQHFEYLKNISDPTSQKEVSDWLNGTECHAVFTAMERGIERKIDESDLNNTARALSTSKKPKSNAAAVTMVPVEDPIYVYVASDNEEVKKAFVTRLEQNNPVLFKKIRIMRVETKFIYHVKNLALLKSATGNEGLLDLVFDWYAMSLSNNLFAWRKGSTGMVSAVLCCWLCFYAKYRIISHFECIHALSIFDC